MVREEQRFVASGVIQNDYFRCRILHCIGHHRLVTNAENSVRRKDMEKRRKKIGWTFSFARMHPVLKTILAVAAGFATVGYVLVGSWLFYFMVTR